MELIKVNEKLSGKYIEYVLTDNKEKYNFAVTKVNPIVIYPKCILNGKKTTLF